MTRIPRDDVGDRSRGPASCLPIPGRASSSSASSRSRGGRRWSARSVTRRCSRLRVLWSLGRRWSPRCGWYRRRRAELDGRAVAAALARQPHEDPGDHAVPLHPRRRHRSRPPPRPLPPGRSRRPTLAHDVRRDSGDQEQQGPACSPLRLNHLRTTRRAALNPAAKEGVLNCNRLGASRSPATSNPTPRSGPTQFDNACDLRSVTAGVAWPGRASGSAVGHTATSRPLVHHVIILAGLRPQKLRDASLLQVRLPLP